MKRIKNNSIDLIIADPPYFSTNIKDVGDNQWKTESEYIDWFSRFINECKRVLKHSGSLYLFHNDVSIMTDVCYYAKQAGFKFRNQITWNKFPTHNNFSRVVKTYGDNRNYGKTFTEYIYYFTLQDDYFETPFAKIMKENMKKQNISQIEISKLELSRNGNLTGWVSNKLKGAQLPTREQWDKICKLFGIDDRYDLLLKEFEEERYPFNQEYLEFKGKSIQEQKELLKPYSTIWEYEIEDSDKTSHKTPKPIKMVDNIVKISSNKNDLVYIPFAGSGSEIISCIENNRNYIASEINKDYVENIINPRIAIFKNSLYASVHK